MGGFLGGFDLENYFSLFLSFRKGVRLVNIFEVLSYLSACQSKGDFWTGF